MKIIGYCRVSSDEQAEGFSLSAQEETIIKYAKQHDHTIVKIFKEDYTGFKDFNRPEWNKIEEYCKKNKKTKLVDGILTVRWDRFSRNEPEATKKISDFKKLRQIEIFTIENYANPDSVEGPFLNSLHLHIAQMESKRNSIRTIDGIRQGLRSGYWMQQAPFGYLNTRDEENKSTLKIDPIKGPVVKEIFDKMATGIYNREELRQQYCKKYSGLSKQTFLDLLRKEVYIGKIKVKEYKDEPEIVVNGKHPAIVEEDIFYTVQKIIDCKTPKMVFNQEKDNIYPLKRFFHCEEHDRSFTASRSTGRIQKHDYYHCSISTCKNRFRLEALDDKVKELLSLLNVKDEILVLYKKVLEDVFNTKQSLYVNDTKEIEKQIDGYKEKINKIDEKYLNDQISDENYNDLKTKLKQELKEAEQMLLNHKSEKIPFKKIVENTIHILPEISKYYNEADGHTKQRILGSMFDGKIVVSEKEVRTTPWKEAIRGLFSLDKDYSDFEIEKVGNNTDFSNMAPQAGLEPATL